MRTLASSTKAGQGNKGTTFLCPWKRCPDFRGWSVYVCLPSWSYEGLLCTKGVVALLNCPQQYESNPHAVLVGGRSYLSLWYGTPESLVLLSSCDRVQIAHHRHSMQTSNQPAQQCTKHTWQSKIRQHKQTFWPNLIGHLVQKFLRVSRGHLLLKWRIFWGWVCVPPQAPAGAVLRV